MLIDYTNVPSSRCYVLLEQTAVAAKLFQRKTGVVWIASGHTGEELVLPDLNVVMPLADVYQGLTFTEPSETQ